MFLDIKKGDRMKEEINDEISLELPEDEVIEGQGSEEVEDRLEEGHDGDDSEEEGEGEDSSKERERTSNQEIDRATLNRIRRDNFRYLHQIQELQRQLDQQRQEAARLNYLNDVSVNTAAAHYEAAAEANLQRARDMKAAAIDSGDTQAIADTDISLTKAVYEYEQAKKLKLEHDINTQNEQEMHRARMEAERQSQYHQQQQVTVPDYNYPIAEDWTSRNDWFIKGSKNYDQQRHLAANRICDELDRWCYQTGNSHLIGSNEYFDELDNRLNHYTHQQSTSLNHSQQHPSRQNNMANRNVVAPARSRGVPSSPTGRVPHSKQPLTAAEKNMIQRLGVTEEVYRAHKIKSMKNDYMKERLAQYNQR